MKKSDKKGLFSLIIYTFGIVLFSVLFFRIDSDYLWHIKAGEYIFKNGIVRYDIFSWVVNGKYWMSHEWLFEWFIYALKNIFGKFHLFIYCFGCSLVLALLLLFCFYNFFHASETASYKFYFYCYYNVLFNRFI